MKRDLTYDFDFSKEEIWEIFKLTRKLKGKPRSRTFGSLRGRSLAMIFQKPSTRTRVSFEVAMTQLGGHALYLSPNDLQLSRGETIADTARTLSRYIDAIMARVFSHRDIIDLAKNATVPVINGLSDKFHPCQGLTDIYTIWEKLGFPKKFSDDFTIVFIGDGDNNVTNSLLLLCARLGINFRIASPKEYQTKNEIFEIAKNDIFKTGAKIKILNNPREAVKEADVIYTDVWVSMGRQDAEERKRILAPYQINQELLSEARKVAFGERSSRPSEARLRSGDPACSPAKGGDHARKQGLTSPKATFPRFKNFQGHALALPMIMHCLPAHRGEEITDEVIDGPNSIVFDQAENRLHVQKAILYFLLQ